MTPAEREADDAMADVRRIREDAEFLILMTRRRAKMQRADVAAHLNDFANGLQDLIGDDLFLAEQVLAHAVNAAELAAEDRHQRLERRAM